MRQSRIQIKTPPRTCGQGLRIRVRCKANQNVSTGRVSSCGAVAYAKTRVERRMGSWVVRVERMEGCL